MAVVAAAAVADMSEPQKTLLGLGFRAELALFIERHQGISFVEILAEDFPSPGQIPEALKVLHRRGIEIIPHSTSLSLGSTTVPSPRLLKHLDELARYFDAPFVSDHIALVRAGGLESGHLLPVPRNQTMVELLKRNIAEARAGLSVPLVLENIATTFDWPAAHTEMNEAQFLRLILEETDSKLLLDVSNLFANSFNHRFDAGCFLRELPLERLEYVHLAGGAFKQGLYHDTHCHPLRQESLKLLSLLASLCRSANLPLKRVMLERDDNFAEDEELASELAAIEEACRTLPLVVAPAVSSIVSDASTLAASASMSNSPLAEPELSCPAVSAGLLPARAPSEPGPARPAETFRTGEGARSSQTLESIEACQRALLSALLQEPEAGGSSSVLPPELSGFDKDLLWQAGQSLVRKRLRTMKRACPYLMEIFPREEMLDQALRRFYRDSPSPSAAGPYTDAMHFLLYLHGKKHEFAAVSGYKLTPQAVKQAQRHLSQGSFWERLRQGLFP